MTESPDADIGPEPLERGAEPNRTARMFGNRELLALLER
jgi:hypothetical protein